MKESKRSCLRRHGCSLLAVACVVMAGRSATAQISLRTAVDLSLKNSPKIRAAQADLEKTRAAHSMTKQTYVPVIATEGGYGQSTGAPLGVPVIFSISAQSLVFSFSQRDYIRSAEESIHAAEHSLVRQQIEVVEDVTNTYIALDNAVERQKVIRREIDITDRLVLVTGERVSAGVDAKVELPRSRRTATQIKLADLQLNDEIAGNAQHLAVLTGLPAESLRTDGSSIPKLDRPAAVRAETDPVADDEGVASAFSAAKAKQYAAFGDRRYLLRPQVALAANYSRVDAGLSSYASYYPRFNGTPGNPNSSNSLGFGLQVTIPLLDLAHRSKAKESEADAARAFAEAEMQRGVFREGQARLRNSAMELDLRAQLARDDQEIAQDQLETLRLQLQAISISPNGPQLTPRDELNAQLQERQKYMDVLNAELQLRQTQVSLLRQNGGLSTWVIGTAAAAGSLPFAPGSQTLTPRTNTPGVPGTPPSGTVPVPGSTPVVPVTPTVTPRQ